MTERMALYLQDAHNLRDGLEYVRYAESRGFEAVWQAESRLVRDAIVPMAAYAAVTERLKVGSGVINNWTRNIGLLASTFLTLDDLAPNRVICGIGSWWDPLAKNVGIDRKKPLTAMKEAEMLAETQTWLAHQPRSNSNNAVGLVDVDSLLRLGIKVCMGNDGFSNAMWDEWRTAYLAHKLVKKDPRVMSGDMVIEVGVYNNALLARHFFPNAAGIGSIQPGAPADLILVDYQPITEMTTGNLPWQILFGFRDSMVTMTMVDGEILMKDRKLTQIDEKRVYSEARSRSKEVWKRYQNQF